jgi:hypothetical protein
MLISRLIIKPKPTVDTDPGPTLLTSEEENSRKKEIDKKKGCRQ